MQCHTEHGAVCYDFLPHRLCRARAREFDSLIAENILTDLCVRGCPNGSLRISCSAPHIVRKAASTSLGSIGCHCRGWFFHGGCRWPHRRSPSAVPVLYHLAYLHDLWNLPNPRSGLPPPSRETAANNCRPGPSVIVTAPSATTVTKYLKIRAAQCSVLPPRSHSSGVHPSAGLAASRRKSGISRCRDYKFSLPFPSGQSPERHLEWFL